MRLHPGVAFTRLIALKNAGNLAVNDLTPSVSLGNIYLCSPSHTAARSLTNFYNGESGQILIIKGANPTYKTTLSDGTYLKLNGNWVEALNSTITLINISNVWYELCRSANA